MDLAELSQKTQIDRRKLRYVLDHELVPRLKIEIVDSEVGRPRHFAEDVGFAIACAAKLLEIGLAHKTIRLFLSGLLEIRMKDKRTPALATALERNRKMVAEFGDGQFVRLHGDDFDSGWIAPQQPRNPRRDFVPTASLVLDIGRVREQVFGADR